MRILLTGRNGQVGWELERALSASGEVMATDRRTLDLADAGAIRRVVRDATPELIVNAGAYTAVDKAESEREMATRVNAVAPGLLADEAKRLGASLVHYSTDYVFDGTKGSPYTEADSPNPLSHYARTKLEGESAIMASGCRYLILRTSWVYSPRATNFYRIILSKAQANEPMRMVDDQTSVPTPSDFVAKYTQALISRNAEGILHLVPSGCATRYEFACQVVKAIRSQSRVEPARTDAFPSPARRPVFSVLDNRRASAALGVRLPDWKDVLP